ncbi:hypothetical protein [Erythrobacter crassostreae]|uniref:Uncharacterized protein n=1 Tax=Erythrobacter crassostreae TaxID=2828328 RepID=A0A9X1F722_9SPHN|nr:hypothetical protein [Erythrobacter crassostrea]MBV7259985.1 hypothetical protein [Erythrobacter crassostrea]
MSGPNLDQFGAEEVLKVMQDNMCLSKVSEVECVLDLIAGPIAQLYDQKDTRADAYLETLHDAFAAMRDDFDDRDARAIGKFLNVIIAATQ